MKFTILSYNPSKDYMWTMHKAGCSDIDQELKGVRTDSGFPAVDPQTIEAKDYKEASEQWIDEELKDMGYTTDAIKINPCCKKTTPDYKCKAPWANQAGCKYSAGDGKPDSLTVAEMSICNSSVKNCPYQVEDKPVVPKPPMENIGNEYDFIAKKDHATIYEVKNLQKDNINAIRLYPYMNNPNIDDFSFNFQIRTHAPITDSGRGPGKKRNMIATVGLTIGELRQLLNTAIKYATKSDS